LSIQENSKLSAEKKKEKGGQRKDGEYSSQRERDYAPSFRGWERARAASKVALSEKGEKGEEKKSVKSIFDVEERRGDESGSS